MYYYYDILFHSLTSDVFATQAVVASGCILS